MHVAVLTNERGRYLEVKISDYEACNEIFLKIPEDKKNGEEWALFANKLKHMALDGVKEGALKIATMQRKVEVSVVTVGGE